MSELFGLVVRFTLKPGAGASFDRLVETTAEQIKTSEPGTLIYTCHRVDGQPDQRIFYELYADRAAFDAHEAQPHVIRFLAERAQYIASTEVDFLSIHTGKGIPGKVG
ncbi:antibiotic biosynthesis monooxygenase [Actinomadura sp. NPDC047616]|uniref:putative quinol monooxygenase n=1 Tax=Actinomadura sp. NPDC047616 TaxID=3155914 RepID=UPI0033C8C268